MEIWQLTATEVAGAVRTGVVSAEEVTRSALDRVAAVNPAVNALVEIREEAIEEARHADELRRRGEPVGTLHGLPVTSKMNTNVEGLPTTDAVAAYADHVAPETDPQVASLLCAGAILIGRTNCPPFATRWTTESDLYGATINPLAPGVTPGGSSGGAAAAVATGMGVLAQGNDIGGSLRYPAACCGVIGLRPSPGRIPGWAGPVAFDPPMAYQAFVEQGPIARTVADVRLGLTAMEAYDPRDPRAVASVSRIPAGSGLPRVGVLTDPGGGGLRGSSTPASVAATRRAAAWLAEAGYEVEEVEQPIFGDASRLWWELALTEFAIAVRAEVARVGEPGYRRFFDYMYNVYEQEFGDVDLSQFVAGWAKRGRLRREISVFMDRYPLILTPVSGEPPFPMGADAESVDRLAEIMSHQWPSMSVPTLGLPALGMPAELPADAAPLGVQIVGRPFEDEAVLTAGEVVEARLGLSRPVDPRQGDR
ncbi:amidase [Nocardioides bizhenqiangii]|uniref:Amidase n=1 Tax=Nocardioides bizhenqiangii TaxID=3095076 RepID=A0ABZ0ZUQ8_9ACTN|nr:MULTISPECIES: amidase [unclassified Nocardioides]MDZ5621760.1 amidase [Nocardioides sp. HM23]WQQ27554.1 amidase [Nocardioides sp. HM61]